MKNDVQSGRSFMCRRNSIGPKTEHWGTPHKISLQEDSKSTYVLSSICKIISNIYF